MLSKATGLLVIAMLIFSACTLAKAPVGTQGEETNPTINPKKNENNNPNMIEIQDFTSDCSKVVIPSNVERDTNLDTEKGVLTVHWYDESKGKNVGVVFGYRDQSCSQSTKQLIQHVLQSESTSVSKRESAEERRE